MKLFKYWIKGKLDKSSPVRKRQSRKYCISLMLLDIFFFIFQQCLTALSDLKATSLKNQLLVPGLFFAEAHAGNGFHLEEFSDVNEIVTSTLTG